MDSNAVLDYALFQLTPTRTRCELILFSGAVRQKIASGLFEPFVAHLKFLRDEISKGGYSIKLLPPTNAAYWFSKATFERFVRFVSTPAVLERFVSIEKEILQIENSLDTALSMPAVTPDEGSMPQTNGITRRLSDSTKLNDVLEGVDNKEEENSKISLQRLLESRIALLRKEQAMAYTRGLVAGFEIESIDDLIYFANAFGASRLREACINFKELWKKKHADDLWIKEVAAMQSNLPLAISFSETSGIILANDITNGSNPSGDENVLESSNLATLNKKDVNLPTTDQKPSHMANVHMPMPWPYNVPPYMYNLQNPIQQMPSYQGYPMQSIPPYLLRNMQWPSDVGANQKHPATKKEKSRYKKGPEEYEDQQTESSDPDSGSESNSDEQKDSNHSKDDAKRKKNRRKSSGTVVIRNINYITPKRRNGNEGGASDESSVEDDDVIDEETIKQKVGVALESLQKVHKVEKRANGKKAGARRNVTKSSDATEEDLGQNSSKASEGGKTNDNWDVFKNLLKINEDDGTDGPERMQPIDVQDEQFVVRKSEERMLNAANSPPDMDFKEVQKNPKVPNDSFIVTHRDGGNEGGSKLDEYVDNCGPVTKSRDCRGEEIFLSHRSAEPGNERGDPLSTFVADSSETRGRTSDDWFVVDNLDKMRSADTPVVPKAFDGDYTPSSVNGFSHTDKRSEGTLIDDSFMIQGQLLDNDHSDSQWKMDISMVADLSASNKLESDKAASNEKHALLENQEPSDLCVVLQRDSVESVGALWTNDYEIDLSFSETDRRSSADISHDNVNNNLPDTPKKTNASKSKVPGTRSSEKEEKSKALRGSFGKGKPEIMSRNRKPSLPSRPVVHKSKREQEEEIRKKMEEMLNERQRRIAERTASSGLARAASKKDQIEGKTTRISPKTDKNKTQSIKETNGTSSVKIRGI